MNNSELNFDQQSQQALNNPYLQAVLSGVGKVLQGSRANAISQLANFSALKQQARAIKDHTLENLDRYLDEYAQQVKLSGGQVHWAETPEEFNQIIAEISQAAQAKKIIKGKSMITEETHLNRHLAQRGHSVRETDLGEYIIQLVDEPPSHILAPAVHKSIDDVREIFIDNHPLGERDLPDVDSMVAEARQVLRKEFHQADVGIIGANALIAENGSNMLVTNEGNGDLCSILPKVHIVAASIEKLVPTLNDATTLLQLLVRSATGQSLTSYTSFYRGPKQASDPDGPQEFHVVLLDNGRSEILSGKYRAMLRCIRCSACMNHCPIYLSVGGHAYGGTYPGPMGSVLTPLLGSLEQSKQLPNACTACGRCEEVCPMGIPLPELLRQLRVDQFEQKITSKRWRWGLSLFMSIAARPTLYHCLVRPMTSILAKFSGNNGRFKSLLIANGWTQVRDFPAPQGDSFISQYQRKQRRYNKHRNAQDKSHGGADDK